MAKMVINKDSQTFGGGVNTSSRATFGLKIQAVIASISEAIKRIFTQLSHKPQCHSELGSESHVAKIPCQARDDKRGILPLCKALAFTLAETLIVMGIIGVVAALTIPNLNSSTADKEKVAKVKKIYSNLNDAAGRASAVYGTFDTWTSTMTSSTLARQGYFERLTEFMKVTKTCAPNVAGCFASNTFASFRAGYSSTDNVMPWYKAVLADGTSFTINPGAYDSCNYSITGVSNICGVIYVDIDGPNKGSHKFGQSVFMFLLTNDNGVMPIGISGASTQASDLANCFKFGTYCTGWVIENGNMDYLKVDLSGKCPNGKVLNGTTVTTCK